MFFNKEMIMIILSLAWPTMLEQLMQTAVQYIDTAMVGSLAGNAYGAKDRKKMKDLSNMFIPIEVTLMFVTGSALFAVAPAFMGIFHYCGRVYARGRKNQGTIYI